MSVDPQATNSPNNNETSASQPQTDGSTAAPAAPPPTTTRPAPAYGEYAPEGWQWKPEAEEAD